MIVPLPPNAAEPFKWLHRKAAVLERIAATDIGPTMERVREAVAAFERALARHTPEPRPQPGTFYILDETHVWKDLGHVSGNTIIGLDYGYLDGPETVIWPRQYGKSELRHTAEFTFEGPHADIARLHFESLFAADHARQERRLARLAHELGISPRAARIRFDAVQRVLEETGVADGYGRLTLTQPVRPDPLHP